MRFGRGVRSKLHHRQLVRQSLSTSVHGFPAHHARRGNQRQLRLWRKRPFRYWHPLYRGPVQQYSLVNLRKNFHLSAIWSVIQVLAIYAAFTQRASLQQAHGYPETQGLLPVNEIMS